VLRILWSFCKQLGVMLADILVVVFAVAGISIMVKYLGKAMILALPLVVIAVGLLLLWFARMRRRSRERRARALQSSSKPR
jgi:lipopolysaccharide export LptBFGC system permease protein LptF